MKKNNQANQLKGKDKPSPERNQQVEKQKSLENSPQKQVQRQKSQEKKAKREELLKQSGVFEAYEYLLKQLIVYGLPKENLFEFASLQVLKYERHLKNMQLQTKVNQPKLKNLGNVKSSFQQAEIIKKELEQQNYLKQLEEIKKNLEIQTQLQKQRLLMEEESKKGNKDKKGKITTTDKNKTRNKSQVQNEEKNPQDKKGKEKQKPSDKQKAQPSSQKPQDQQKTQPPSQKPQDQQKMQPPSSKPLNSMKSPRTENIRSKNEQSGQNKAPVKEGQKENQKPSQPSTLAGKQEKQSAQAPQTSDKQPYTRGRKK